MPDHQDENKLIAERRGKLSIMRKQAGTAFPNDFRRDAMAGELLACHEQHDREHLEGEKVVARVAGRVMSQRIMGKASFVHIQDSTGRIQLFVQQDALPESYYQHVFKTWDVGDIIGAKGELFRTRKGELSIRVSEIRLLTKSLRPLPEKFHGLTDTEARYRQRYVDLIMNPEVRDIFRTRTALIDFMRGYFNKAGFLEVETPMMQAIPGGAVARPFVTYHNALHRQLYLRVAPELYLKRLVVGGIESVYEINRNFRNEGLSSRHSPEFTMIEFYKAYADYLELMDITEDLLRSMTGEVLGASKASYQGEVYDFAQPFVRMTVKESILHFNPELTVAQLDSLDEARKVAKSLAIPVRDNHGLGRVQLEIFEKTVEHRLRQPTFITAYPTEVSPLARRNDDDPFVVDRFEFFIGGREVANGFSELNDAEEQAERFERQAAEKGDGDYEAMHYDADYIAALEYGLPPTAGEGIGIDRLVMLLTDSPSIRDVLLFPQMRPES